MPNSLPLAAGLALLAACGACGACTAGERQAPSPDDFVIAKPDSNSGDRQVGVAGKPLGADRGADG